MTTATFVDYYKILDLPETATEKEITDALKNQRRVWIKRTGVTDLNSRQAAEQRVRDLDEAERVLLNAGRRQQFNEARKLAPPEPAPPVGGDGDWLARSRQLFSSGNAAAANFAAREALNTQGGSHEAWSMRAQSAFLLGDWREAEFSYNEAIRIKPDEPSYYFDLGCAFEELGNHPQALAKYEQALKLDAQNPVYKTSVASIFLKNGMTERARPLMEEVVKAHPNFEPFQYYLAWAIADSYDDYCTVLKNGSYQLTSAEQVARLRSEMQRAQSLKFSDAEMRGHISRRLKSAEEAEKIVWDRPPLYTLAGKAWVALFIVGALLLGLYGAGVLVLAPAIFGYFKLYKMPQWQKNARHLKKQPGNVAKWGIGSRPR